MNSDHGWETIAKEEVPVWEAQTQGTCQRLLLGLGHYKKCSHCQSRTGNGARMGQYGYRLWGEHGDNEQGNAR